MKKVFILFTLTACISSQENNLNEESFRLHEEALEAGKSAKEKISLIAVEVQTETDSSLIDSLKSLQKAFEDWNASIVEVPGYEHDHQHHDHHEHDHSTSPDLTPKMVFEIQSTIKRNAESLDKRAEQLLASFKMSGGKISE